MKRTFYLLLFFLGFVQLAQAQAIAQIRTKLGKVTDAKLSEISGVVPSVVHQDCFFVHNDSGDSAVFYLIDNKARLLCAYKMEGVKAVDMEDVAWLTIDQRPYLLFGDIGDNRARRDEVRFYLVAEPRELDEKSKFVRIPSDQITTFRCRYPDRPRDAEAFFIDPKSKTLFLFSKRDFQVQIFSADFLNGGDDAAISTFRHEGTLPFFFPTSADISRDGKQVLIKNLTDVYYWNTEGQTAIPNFWEILPMKKIPYEPEPQGEAISFGLDGKTFYTISERPLGLDSYLYQYNLR